MSQPTIESVIEIITKCRNGSMDDKQFKATVEHNVLRVQSEERARCVEIVEKLTVTGQNTHEGDTTKQQAELMNELYERYIKPVLIKAINTNNK